MYLLGIDLGTSSIKVSLVDIATQQEIAAASYPEIEAEISSPEPGWAEQDPEMWWANTLAAIGILKSLVPEKLGLIKGIGISYQMHGLVMVDKNQTVLRPSIIWCDSRAVETGKRAFEKLGSEAILSTLLNSPGNFTASKLAWVKENEPDIYAQCYKIMLPGDYLAMKFTGDICTTASGLSEGIFWDFKKNEVSKDILGVYGFSENIIPEIKPTFSVHGKIKKEIASETGISNDAVISYKAGDQPNNALSLNVLEPGEIAATAGTSGVVYAVSDQVSFDPASRINSFAHVNHGVENHDRIGILLCINGTGILNRWIKEQMGSNLSYSEMNNKGSQIPVGSDGLLVMPFGNGSERMLGNANIGAQFINLDLNFHTIAHMFRAAQEGIVYSLAYGFEMMKNLGVKPKVIRAGKANMFLSPIFTETLVNTTNVPVEMYDTNGAKGAALASGVGVGVFANLKEALSNLTKIDTIYPSENNKEVYIAGYEKWKTNLERILK
jgi:xylulokinase